LSEAELWDDRYREKPLLWSAEPNRFVAAELANLAPGTAVDVACGEGRNSVWLAERGWRVTGVDFSSVALERARAMAAERRVEVEWIQADVLSWQPALAFDLVVLAYVHLLPDDRDRLMEKATGWVAPGGHLFIVGHDVSTVGVSGPPDPRLLWDPQTAAAAAAPLDVIFCERRYRDIEVGRAADTVLLAHRGRERREP
jgi:SAM-dependent methyltransferase